MMGTADWSRLLARCLSSGDDAAWNEFLRAAYPIVARVMMGRADAETAKDLIQSVFAKLLEDDGRRLRAFDASFAVPFPAYLRVIAVRHAIDWSRSRGALDGSRHVDLTEVATTLGVDPEVHARERARELWEATEKLPAQQRTATLLLLEGLTVQEVARCMGLSEGGAAALLWRARARLRELLGIEP